MKRFGNRLVILFLAVYWPLVFVGTHLPVRGGGAGELPVNDKLIHAAIFFGLGFLLALAVGRGTAVGSRSEASAGRKGLFDGGWVLLLAIGVGYAAIDEWSQRFVVGRYPDVRDFVADVGGFVLGSGVGRAIASRLGSPRGGHSHDSVDALDEGRN